MVKVLLLYCDGSQSITVASCTVALSTPLCLELRKRNQPQKQSIRWFGGQKGSGVQKSVGKGRRVRLYTPPAITIVTLPVHAKQRSTAFPSLRRFEALLGRYEGQSPSLAEAACGSVYLGIVRGAHFREHSVMSMPSHRTRSHRK